METWSIQIDTEGFEDGLSPPSIQADGRGERGAHRDSQAKFLINTLYVAPKMSLCLM